MNGHARGRLDFRPRSTTGQAGDREEPLGLGDPRDGFLYVPATAERAAPLLLFLHGATGSGRSHVRLLLGAADRYGVIVVAPDSRSPHSWDLIADRGFGPDVAFIDGVLDAVVDRVDADASRFAVGGVSDGASYALALGLSNGDVFGTVIAFSPGFLAVPEPAGRPQVFVSHGTQDPILPIDQCSRDFVPALRGAGYDVSYREFNGGHTVPPEVADEAVAWWVKARPAAGTAEP